ncbi:pyridoxal-phosphate dependent enzyme [Actinomycetes bacterium KLBMP 9797]
MMNPNMVEVTVERVALAALPTPLQPMDRLGERLGLPPGRLWVKRDDLTGLALGGNKARKLEYSAAEALAAGADTLVTGGAAQSNHVRMTAAAAARLGLGCVAVLTGTEPSTWEGNLLLSELLGVQVRWAGRVDYAGLNAAITEAADIARQDGSRPYVLPVGGASLAGDLGYVTAAVELRRQLPDLALVITADASGGTHAGLVAGLGDHRLVLGVDTGNRPDLLDAVPRMAADAAGAAGLPAPTGSARLDRGQIGGGYGQPTPAGRHALELAARTEGLLLEPVYTAKAMASLLAHAIGGRLPEGPVVFLHTGGYPELFIGHYNRWLRTAPAVDRDHPPAVAAPSTAPTATW